MAITVPTGTVCGGPTVASLSSVDINAVAGAAPGVRTAAGLMLADSTVTGCVPATTELLPGPGSMTRLAVKTEVG